jgi:hypothetical protein
MTDTDLLSFLVDETFKLQRSGEAKLSSLELKLSDYGLCFLKGEFIPQIQVLRFKLSGQILDIPANWSIFSLSGEESLHQVLHEGLDPDHLFRILREVWLTQMKKLLVTHADGFCYLVGLKAGDDAYLHDLLNPQECLKAAA